MAQDGGIWGQDPSPPSTRAGSDPSPTANPPSPQGLSPYQPFDAQATAGKIYLWTWVSFLLVSSFISQR